MNCTLHLHVSLMSMALAQRLSDFDPIFLYAWRMFNNNSCDHSVKKEAYCVFKYRIWHKIHVKALTTLGRLCSGRWPCFPQHLSRVWSALCSWMGDQAASHYFSQAKRNFGSGVGESSKLLSNNKAKILPMSTYLSR